MFLQAYLELEEPFVFTDSVKAICLSGSGEIKAGEQAVLAGWGLINGLISIIQYL